MAERPMKMPAKNNSDDEAPEVVSQRAKPERGRYLLQVDRQTKGSFQDMEAAQSAGREIKAGFPILHVAIYDSVNGSHTLVQSRKIFPASDPAYRTQLSPVRYTTG